MTRWIRRRQKSGDREESAIEREEIERVREREEGTTFAISDWISSPNYISNPSFFSGHSLFFKSILSKIILL